jgi:hypothetical protein
MARIAYLFLFGEKKFIVPAGVTHMAGKTFPLGCHRFVGHAHIYILIRVTAIAKFSTFFGQQILVLRSMGIMARTTLSLLEGCVLDITTALEVCLFVAVVTKAASLLPGFEGLLRNRGSVAFFAVNLGHYRMYAGFQQLGLE